MDIRTTHFWVALVYFGMNSYPPVSNCYFNRIILSRGPFCPKNGAVIQVSCRRYIHPRLYVLMFTYRVIYTPYRNGNTTVPFHHPVYQGEESL